MSWLKYTHRFSSGHSMEWLYLGDYIPSDDELKDIVSEIEDKYSYSDKYSGIRYELVDLPPRHVLEQHYNNAKSKAKFANQEVHKLTKELAKAKDCPQCADVPTVDERTKSLEYRIDNHRPCPYCGRHVDWSTLKYLLDPVRDLPAIKLLKNLSNHIYLTDNDSGMTYRDTMVSGAVTALQKLIDLGLAGGSSFYGEKTKWTASKRGIAEAGRHLLINPGEDPETETAVEVLLTELTK